MNITLYKAAGEVRQLLDQIDPETGELPAELEQARGVVATKARAVAAYILEEELVGKAVEDHLHDLTVRERARKKRMAWLRQYLASHMAACGITEIRDDRGIFRATLAPGRDKSVEIFDALQLPSDCLREVPAKHEPDKALIRKAIDAGRDVPGARVVVRDRLTLA